MLDFNGQSVLAYSASNLALWCGVQHLKDLDVGLHQTPLLAAIVAGIKLIGQLGPDRLFTDAGVIESVNKLMIIDATTVTIADRQIVLSCRKAITLMVEQFKYGDVDVDRLRQIDLETDPFVALDVLREALLFLLFSLQCSVN